MACRTKTLPAAAALAVMATCAHAAPELIGLPRGAIRVGDPSPGGFPLETVTEINAVEFNNVGGWGALVVSRIALSDSYRHEIYGAAAEGSATALLRRDATIGPYTQTTFSPRFALGDDAAVLYNARSIHDPTMVEMNTLWRGPELLAAQTTQVAGITNTYYAGFADVALDLIGDPLVAANVSTSPLAAPFNQMLLRGGGQNEFFGSDPIAGIPDHAALGPDIFGDRLALTPSGEHWLTTVRLSGAPPREALVRDGAVVTHAGAPVVEDSPVPPSAGFDGQRWGDAIDYDTNDAGSTIYATRTRSGAGATLETFPCLVMNDQLLFQSGDPTSDPASPAILTNFAAVEINAQGDYVCAVTFVEPPAFLMLHALMVNGHIILRQGDQLDRDADNQPDTLYTDLAPLAPIDAMLELSDRDADDVVRVAMIADSVSGRALFMLDVRLDHVFPPCPADLADPQDGELDFSDVLAFLAYFADEDPNADLAAPEGVFDFSDVFAFLVSFAAGCPEE